MHETQSQLIVNRLRKGSVKKLIYAESIQNEKNFKFLPSNEY